MAIVETPVYRRTLARWKAGAITIREVELLIKTKWLTREQADDIYTYERVVTELVVNDPFTVERLGDIQENDFKE
jgi:hypothetical protein